MTAIADTRVSITRATLIFTVIFAPVDGLVKLHNGDSRTATLLIFTTASCAVVLWLMRQPRYHVFAVRALLIILAAGFLLGFPSLAQHPEMVIWLPLYPFYFYSLGGRRVGALLSGASAVYLYLIYLWADYSQVVNIPEVAVAYVLSIVLAHAHEEVHCGEREKLERMAHLDSLTGAYNRHGLSSLWGGVWRRAEATDTDVALALLDIDHFKDINDRHGHDAGDAVLREVVAVLRERLRASDYVVRWGGEEFLLLLPGATAAQAQRIADSLRGDIAAHDFENLDSVTASFGVASVREAGDFETALKRADDALYCAKSAGRNCIRLAAAEAT